MYHRVSRAVRPTRYTVSEGEFRRQMTSLRNSGYRVLSLADTIAQLERSPVGAGNVVCITFDDGFMETFEVAASILSEFQFSATFFLVSGLVGLTNRWDLATGSEPECALMGWREAKCLLAAGFDIGSHSVNHPVLTELSGAAALDEICRSKQDIEENLGVATRYFAYPYGRFDSRIRALVADAGYEAACSTLSGFANPENDRFALRRIEVFGTDSVRVFLRKVKFGANAMSAAQVLRYYVKQSISRLVAAGQ
jgi:peptidoglycan/xylan/chitin deacetylase (PgdA/CDA1 family)